MPEPTSPEPRIVQSVKTIADTIRFAKPHKDKLGKVIFLIGAGCSVSAGIPGAVEIAQRMVCEAASRFGLCADDADSTHAYSLLVKNDSLTDAGGGFAAGGSTPQAIDWHNVYDEMFRTHYCTPDDTRELFGRVMETADGAINWAHLCLGELAARRYVSTVLTTNFDQLVLSGMVRAGLLPVVCDGVESLNRIAGAPLHPQLVELHGSRHTYLLRNRPDDVAAIWRDPQALSALRGLFQHATTFIVVGYGGREEGVMDLLVQAAESYRDKNLYWVQRSGDPKVLSAKAKAFLATSRNGGLVVDQDADAFFLDLCRHLGVGAPTAIAQPLCALERVIAEIEKSRVTHDDIRKEIASAKARVERLKDALTQAVPTIESDVAAIRERRLAGDYAGAYHLAEALLAR